MTVIDFATHSLEHSERQYELGNSASFDDMKYWAAYIDGAKAQKREDLHTMRALSAEKENLNDE